MIGLRLFVPLFLLVLLVVLLVQLWRRRCPLELDPSRLSEVLAAHHAAVGWRWAGFGLGVAAAFATASVESLGRGVILAPAVFGLCVIVGVIVGELATTASREGIRTAALETRSVGGYLPKRLSGLVAASTIGLGALLVTTTLMGSADDLDRAGRSLFRQCSADWSSSAGPWPGLFYSVPLAIAVTVGLVGAVIALHTVVLRPRSSPVPEFVATDDILRRRSAEAVVAATGVMVAASLFGVSLLAGGTMLGFECRPGAWVVMGVVLLGVGVLMLLLTLWCLALLLSGPRIRATVSGDAVEAGEATSR